MRVTIRNKIYDINKEDVEKKLEAIEPNEGRARYFVEIGAKQFPIKQALSEALNLLRPAFTTQEAFTILQRLGFEITRRN